jgi:hypothetical protein
VTRRRPAATASCTGWNLLRPTRRGRGAAAARDERYEGGLGQRGTKVAARRLPRSREASDRRRSCRVERMRERDLRHRREAQPAEQDRDQPGEKDEEDDAAGTSHPARAAAARIFENGGLAAGAGQGARLHVTVLSRLAFHRRMDVFPLSAWTRPPRAEPRRRSIAFCRSRDWRTYWRAGCSPGSKHRVVRPHSRAETKLPKPRALVQFRPGACSPPPRLPPRA